MRLIRNFRSDAQSKAASDRAGRPLTSPLVARYSATLNGAAVGRAYVDTHVVRTKRESVLVSLDAQGRVKRVDVIAFVEPPEYRAPQAFINQFTGRGLDPIAESLSGGDDYELLFTIRPRLRHRLRAVARAGNVPLTRIGVCTPETAILLRRVGGDPSSDATFPGGYTHFR